MPKEKEKKYILGRVPLPMKTGGAHISKKQYNRHKLKTELRKEDK